MRRSAVTSPSDAADSNGSVSKRRALSEIPFLSYDTEPAYCCPSIPAHCVVNGDDVSMHLQGDLRCRRYAVVYGRVSARKHKRWEGDGVLVCRDRFAMLQTEDGKDIARVSAFSKRHLDALEPGHRLVIGGFELEVQDEIHGENKHESSFASSSYGSASAADAKLDDSFQSASGRVSSCSSDRKLGRRFVQPLLRTNTPTSSCDFIVNKSGVDARGEDAVILDGRLARHLRPHQKEGLTFLFERLKNPGGGVILADEMGLGKSVQAISLLWVLLKQFKQKGAINMKFILITPTSLIGNWRCEFNKWLPHSGQLLFPITKTSEVRRFAAYSGYSPVLLISYDVVVRCAELLEKISFALMICDEAHRLKNFNGNLRQSINRLRTERRLLLTGTPIQNDMSEFFSLLDLAKPSAFGSLVQFRNMMTNEDGVRGIQLLLSEVLLRRTADVNFNNLPPRHEYVLWCRLSKVQQLIYNRIVGLASSDHLAIIDMLRKLCNHPSILYQSLTSKHGAFNWRESALNATVLGAFPSSFEPDCSTILDSGKLSVFVQMMVSLRETNEKVVVVSNFTKTLDMLNEVCQGIFCTVTRLDGSVVPHKRMQLVDEFNTSSLPNHVFLLSTKAGGVGLNLIGASRLVLFDSDWNPAFDVQAMARIWRDGQKMPCHIYRLVTAGTIDEKILQRQVMKSGLGTVVELDSLNESMTIFSDEDLADIFSLNTQVACATHELMECKCGGCGSLLTEVGDEVDESEINKHEHSPTVDDSNTSVKNPQDTKPVEGCVSIFDYIESDYSEKKAGQAECPLDAYDSAPFDIQKTEPTQNADASGKAPSVSILMGALARWRHYSPECEQQFEQMKLAAGLQLAALREVTFVMKRTSNY